MAFYNSYQYPQYGYQPQQPQIPQQMAQQMPQQMSQMSQMSQQPVQQIQNGGFLAAPNEEYVRTYPVALGNCVTFKIEGKPYVMEKSMGFSQLDSPKIEKYRLVKEEPSECSNSPQNDPEDIRAIISSIDKINEQIEALWSEIEAIKANRPKAQTKNSGAKQVKDENDDQS